MDKVILVIKRLEYGRSEVALQCEGDIWQWKKKNRRKVGSEDAFSEVFHKQVHKFMYDMQLNKFVKRFKGIVDEVVEI